MNSKNIVYLITFIIDIILIKLLFCSKNTDIDLFYIKTILFCHLIFYYVLYKQISIIIDILHVLVFVLSFMVIFINNKQIKLIVIGLLLLVQILWILQEKCILNDISDLNNNLCFGKTINIIVLLFTCYLIYQISK